MPAYEKPPARLVDVYCLELWGWRAQPAAVFQDGSTNAGACGPPPVRRGSAHYLIKMAVKAGHGTKADFFADRQDGIIGHAQKAAGFCNARPVQVVQRSHADKLPEHPAKMGFAHAAHISKVTDAEIFHIEFINIGQCRCNDHAVCCGRIILLGGKPHDFGNQGNKQPAHADFIVLWLQRCLQREKLKKQP